MNPITQQKLDELYQMFLSSIDDMDSDDLDIFVKLENSHWDARFHAEADALEEAEEEAWLAEVVGPVWEAHQQRLASGEPEDETGMLYGVDEIRAYVKTLFAGENRE